MDLENEAFMKDAHNFVTIANLSKEKLRYLIEMAAEFEKHPNREILKGKIIATLFLNRPLEPAYLLKQQPIDLAQK